MSRRAKVRDKAKAKATKAPKPQRPYVRDEMGGRVTASQSIGFVLLALLTGFVIGFAIYLVMNLSTWLTELLWSHSDGFFLFPLAVCTLGGVIIGLWTWWSRDTIKPLEEVMAEFKRTGSFRTNGVWKPIVTFLLPLVFGGSIGFEAGLTGLITAGCCWIRDQLKHAGLRVAGIADVTIAASFAAIFRTPLAGIAAGAETDPSETAPGEDQPLKRQPREAAPDADSFDMRRGTKVVLYAAAAFGAVGGIRVFSAIFGATGGLPRFAEIDADPSQFLMAIPCLVLAYSMTLIFHASNCVFGMIGARMRESDVGIVASPIACGVVIGAIGCVLPYVLFPGEEQSLELMETWAAWPAYALLATGVIKAAVTPMCIKMGWVGGDFFPSIFAGVAAGFGLSALTGADPMLMVTVTTTAFLAGVVRKPLLVLGILFLCFPADGILWMGVSAVIGATLPLPRALLESAEGDTAME